MATLLPLSAWGLSQLEALNLSAVIQDCQAGATYLEQMTTPVPPYRQQIAQSTPSSFMVSGQLVTHLLQLLIKISGARKVLELGTLTGYSALAMAEVLPPDGHLITCDRNPVALDNFAQVGWGQKIELRVGLIADTLGELVREKWQFDLIFLDADKRNYCNYFRTILDQNLLRSGGILCADNTLFRGQVWQAEPSPTAQALHAFNQLVAQDDRVEQILLPLRDGLTIVYRL